MDRHVLCFEVITFAPHFATLAQLVEHRIRNARVVGSSPMSGSRGDNGSFTRAEHARVLKLVDRLDSGSSVRKDVGVRVPLRAPRKNPDCEVRVFQLSIKVSCF